MGCHGGQPSKATEESVSHTEGEAEAEVTILIRWIASKIPVANGAKDKVMTFPTTTSNCSRIPNFIETPLSYISAHIIQTKLITIFQSN